ncbi:MAG: PAS domain-containing protein, partial [Terrimicrobiaceae bacterium]|nr:PAS domain-containing protein [Terrimicrobiaceae bacterium]
MTTVPQQAWWKAPLRISVIYAVVAAIYIVVSDQALYRAVQGDEGLIAAWQSAKGLAFVAVSSILIFFMVGRRERSAAAARLELEKDEEAFELFFRNAPVPLIVYDRHTRKILEINAAAERLYGGPASAMRGWRIEDLHPPEDFDELMRHLGKEVDEPVALT